MHQIKIETLQVNLKREESCGFAHSTHTQRCYLTRAIALSRFFHFGIHPRGYLFAAIRDIQLLLKLWSSKMDKKAENLNQG